MLHPPLCAPQLKRREIKQEKNVKQSVIEKIIATALLSLSI
jgi:hypothetical protein